FLDFRNFRHQRIFCRGPQRPLRSPGTVHQPAETVKSAIRITSGPRERVLASGRKCPPTVTPSARSFGQQAGRSATSDGREIGRDEGDGCVIAAVQKEATSSVSIQLVMVAAIAGVGHEGLSSVGTGPRSQSLSRSLSPLRRLTPVWWTNAHHGRG